MTHDQCIESCMITVYDLLVMIFSSCSVIVTGTDFHAVVCIPTISHACRMLLLGLSGSPRSAPSDRRLCRRASQLGIDLSCLDGLCLPIAPNFPLQVSPR